MVNSSYENDLLFSAESYLEDFISQDRMISFFRDELKLHTKLINKCMVGGDHFSDLKENQQRLRADFIKAEQRPKKVRHVPGKRDEKTKKL